MGWNKPGKDHDPWGGQRDLDEFFAHIKHRLSRRFSRGDGKAPHPLRPRLWWFAVLILVIVWALSGMYKVSGGQRAVVLRLGVYVETVGTGVHWRWPWPIDTVHSINVKEARSITRRVTALTRDGQWVTAALTVKYRIDNPYQYFYGTTMPTDVLGTGAQAVLFAMVRTHTLQALQHASQTPAAATLSRALSRQLAGADTGIGVEVVRISHLALPKVVSDAREQAVQQQKRTVTAIAGAPQALEAAILKARTRAKRIVSQARVESSRQVAQARVDMARFRALVPAWEKAPLITETMLRNNALRTLLAVAPKVVVSGSVHAVTLPSAALTTIHAPAAKTRLRAAPVATVKGKAP